MELLKKVSVLISIQNCHLTQVKTGYYIFLLIVYFIFSFGNSPSGDQVFMPLLDLSSWNACEVSQPEETASFMGHIVMVNQKGNCSIIEKAQTIEVAETRSCLLN